MTIFTHLCQYINQQFTLPVLEIKSYHRLKIDLRLNDIEVTEVVVFMELLYGLTLPDETLTPDFSLKQICTLIEQRVDSQQVESPFQLYQNPRHVFTKAS